MQDEGFHEIQLNGKQLVFLFMAATVVAVVVFLCGVMVGRGVPQRATPSSDIPQQAAIDPTAGAHAAPVAVVASTGIEPTTARETLTYPERLSDQAPAPEALAPAAPAAPAATPRAPAPKPSRVPPSQPATALAPKPAIAAPTPTVAPRPVPTPAPAAPAAAVPTPSAAPLAVDTSSLTEPAGGGFVVQVAAVRQRAEAERIARRLSTKGYPAFVTTAGANFRIRVGKYDDRSQAEAVAGRLAREEQFKPWITR